MSNVCVAESKESTASSKDLSEVLLLDIILLIDPDIDLLIAIETNLEIVENLADT